jgi:SRSO17 transposase
VAIEAGRPGCHWLLVRRNRRTGELAYYRCWSPRHVPLASYVHVAGRRWTTEENFQAGKGLAGLDEHQLRTWTAWHRWVTLAMLAVAFLTIATATQHDQLPPPGGSRSPATRSPASPPRSPARPQPSP